MQEMHAPQKRSPSKDRRWTQTTRCVVDMSTWFYVNDSGEEVGPVTSIQLAASAVGGTVSEDVLVRAAASPLNARTRGA